MAARAILFIALFLLQANVNCFKCYSKYSPYFRGYFMEARDCPGATLRNSTIKDPNIVCCILDSTIIPSIPQNVSVSLESFIDMVGDTTRTRALYPFYLQALSDAGITGRRHIAAFTAQILYQTSGMKFSEESSNGLEYERKESLGNSKVADGRKYISRGFLPLIGKHMYQLAALSVNSNIISQPEIVALPSIGFKVAAWLWTTGYSSADNSSLPTGNLGKFSKGTEYSFLELSINIQQSTASIETLFHYWRHTQNVIGLQCSSHGNGPKCSVDGRSGRCKMVTSCKGEYSATGCPLATSLVTCCLDCQNPIDLAFVLDSSSSVNPSNFQLGLQFIVKVCEYFNIAYPDGTRVALIRYSNVPTIMFRFNTYVNKQDVLDAIGSVSYEPGLTRTDLALLEAHASLFGNTDHGVRPRELGVPRVLVLLTDGRASQGTASVVQPSELLREEGVNIFVIGIGQTLNKNELQIIASDPDGDHVISSKTFAGVKSLVGNIQESSCYEPALLEEEEEVMSSVVKNSVKYYKYDLLNKTGIKTVFLQTSHGGTSISVSTRKRNPRNYHVNLGSCEIHGDIKLAQDSDPLWQLDDLENSTFCNATYKGGCTEPRFVSNNEFPEEGLIIYVKACSSRWFYVSVEGVNETNTFNLTLFKDLIRITTKKNPDGVSESNHTTFPIPKKVFVGAAVATVGTTAAVAAAVTLSCAKEFQLKGSTKIKKKKGKDKKKNNNSAVNEAFEGDDDEKHSNQNRSSLTPLLESGDLKKRNTRSIHVGENVEKKTDVTTGMKKFQKGNDVEKGDGRASHEQELSRGNSPCSSEGRQRKLSRHGSLVTSMIYDLQREDTIIEKTLDTETPGSGETDSLVEGARFKRQVTSTSVSVSVVTSKGVRKEKVSIDADRVRRFGGETMKRNCDMPLTGLEDTENVLRKTKPKRKDAVTLNSSKGQNHFSSNDLKAVKGENVKQKDGNTTQNSSRSFLDREPEKVTICCFQWQPSLSNNKFKKALKAEEESEGTDTEKTETCEVSDNTEETEKVSFLVRMKRKVTKRKVMAAMCPCFTYFILEDEHDRNPVDKEKGESDKNSQEIRDSRFERDMQMNQAFCVLLSQILFLAGADARDDTIACAAVAIAMNYLSLVTLCWLIVQALYLFSFTRKRESEEKHKMKTKLYYAGAWGLPLIVVCVLASKYEMYDKHPHCWISFADALSWSVATPIITLGMVQLILIVLLAKALITYRKSGDVEENENKISVIKSGLQTVVCITITVILSWLLGSLSLNIDRDIYHTFFSIFNALQGFGFFLFYVVLNPEVRKLILAAWERKSTLVTPFDEHESIEIEEEEDKDKKKGKDKNKATNNNNQRENESEQENQQGQPIANTLQTAADVKMTTVSIVASNKMRNPENVKELKREIKKETRKSSFPGIKANSTPRTLPPLEKQKKNVPSSKGAVPRRKITPRGPPQKVIEDLALKRNAADASSAPKNKSLRSPAPYAQKPRSPSWSRAIQFECKDNLPVAAFSSPPPNVPTRLPQQTVVPNTTRKNQKLVDKKKTTKGKKVSKP